MTRSFVVLFERCYLLLQPLTLNPKKNPASSSVFCSIFCPWEAEGRHVPIVAIGGVASSASLRRSQGQSMLHLACEAYRSSQFRRPKPLESREVDAKSAADCVRRGVDGVAVVSPVKVGVAALFGGCWVLPGSAWFRGDRRCCTLP